jgi:hypothetical protein
MELPSCSIIVILKASDTIPVINFYITIKLINKSESKAVGIKSLSGSCDLKISDKAGYITTISIDGNYVNCSDKD